ncbi:hypothetical protein [Streptomyces sp. NPDC005799]|uniref:hypothetical protein n=1 Tax=Streptomyces sp. NPDC005799 TaxID=3154678 RepID=UPI0033DEF641
MDSRIFAGCLATSKLHLQGRVDVLGDEHLGGPGVHEASGPYTPATSDVVVQVVLGPTRHAFVTVVRLR